MTVSIGFILVNHSCCYIATGRPDSDTGGPVAVAVLLVIRLRHCSRSHIAQCRQRALRILLLHYTQFAKGGNQETGSTEQVVIYLGVGREGQGNKSQSLSCYTMSSLYLMYLFMT